jgi:hypothetical protein
MLIKNPAICTTLEIWQPRYSSLYSDTQERVALLAVYKVEHASPIIIISFTKAAHLRGQRFAIKKSTVLKCPVDSNGSIPCFSVRMSLLEPWQSAAEVKEIIEGFGW